MERPCTITKATLKKFQDAPVNPIAGRRFRSTEDQLVLPRVEHEHRPLALHTGDLTFQITKHNLRQYLNTDTRHSPSSSRDGRRLDDHGREATLETIGVFGNDRPLALNKNPIYVNAKRAASSAKCKHSYEEQKAWANTFVNCPTWGKFLAAECNDGDHECRRDPTVHEGRAFCQDYKQPACRADAIAQAYLGKSCPEHSLQLQYTRCSNRCGQPAHTQKATGVKCFARVTFPAELVWEVDGKECEGEQGPEDVGRMCPATGSCGEFGWECGVS